MKPKPDEAQNTKFSLEERSLLICQTTFEILKLEKWPHPVRVKPKMDFHVSLGFHGFKHRKGLFEWPFTVASCSPLRGKMS